ncbi:MAG: zeta toxin family protein [Microbacteriaceae bacterium]|nr:zeta toxin family protein [Microbacteriaceae bacterium]
MARELESRLRTAGLDNPWSDRAEASSRWLYSDGLLYEASRLRFHSELVEKRRAASELKATGRLNVAITAGAPGSGKSTAIARDPKLAGFRQVDADDFKDDLLLDAKSRGVLPDLSRTELPDGRPVALRELAGFVHAESTAVADAFRQSSFEEGENVVIHGTLSSAQYIDDLLLELDEYGYKNILILDVETPPDRAIERALSRWWQQRTDETDPLGGRLVPPSAIRKYFPSGGTQSISSANASALAERAGDLGWAVELRRVEA